MKKNSIASLLVMLTAFGNIQWAAAAEKFSGDAYDLSSGELLFREEHYRYDADGVAQHLVLYHCPDGRPFARKLARDDGDAQAPDFDLIDARLNYHEGVRRRGNQREVYVQRTANLPELADPLALPAGGVIDAGFDEFVHRHWDELEAGKTVSVPYLVPSRRTFYSFKAKMDNANNANNAATRTIRLSLGAWYAFLVPHIDVVYDRASRRLLHYEGLSNIRNADGKSYKVRIELASAPVPANAGQIAAAQSAPLTASCAVVRADTAATGSSH